MIMHVCRRKYMTHRGASKGDYLSAFEYYSKAAELGDVEAHYRLAHLYRGGKGAEKDEIKSMYHLEEAAIGGHPEARYFLGCLEGGAGNIERAVKHIIIAANLGHDNSLANLKILYYQFGKIGKEDFAAALGAHKAAADATKSEQREAAEEYYKNLQRQRPR